MKIKKDGHLVELLDLDVDAKSQKTPKKKQMGSEQPSRKRPRFKSDPKDGNEGNLPSAMETSQKGKGKVTKSSHRPDVDTDVDIPAEERRMLNIGMTASRLEMDPPLSTTGQTSGRGNNHIPGGDTTNKVPPTSTKVPSDGILEKFVSQMTTMLSNIIEHHGRKNQHLASLEEDLAHAKLEEEKLKATIEALEKEKSKMNSRVALMERKDLYDLFEAKMEGFHIANHPRMIGADILNNNDERRFALSEVNKALKMWKADNVIAGVSFVRGHRTLQDEPLVKGLDADDFSMDKFFGLQDPTSLDDVQASPDFEEDLRINECLRLQAKVRNLKADPQQFTKANELVARYDKTNHAEEAMIKITCLRKSICSELHDEDMQGNLPTWIFVPIHGKNHWSLAIIRLHNDDAWLAHLDSFQGTYDPEAIFHVLKQVLCLIVPIDPALVMTGIMNVEQQ
ncbi:hypothetical protein R1flu_022212 [Riccia fluitans]|uniref:Ubiquitin-like protease family profile domain-containing protein n=1 Tax=Riccia fluitans TaxID=41844 RepID=A0ABD1ZUG2_9MARC